MRQLYLIILIFFYCFSSIEAQDSIVNYLDKKGKIIMDKGEARYIEILTKKDDSLWLVRSYNRIGKLLRLGYFKTEKKEKPVGQFTRYHRNGNLRSLFTYNSNHNKDGKYRSWFDNTNLSTTGTYINDKKEGVWSYFRMNNDLAGKDYYKNDSILKTVIFDEKGNIINKKPCNKKAEFKGGIKKFNQKLKGFVDYLDYKINGKIYVYFTVDIDGSIKDVSLDVSIPKQLENQIREYFEDIKGWAPAFHKNRKIPSTMNIALNFQRY